MSVEAFWLSYLSVSIHEALRRSSDIERRRILRAALQQFIVSDACSQELRLLLRRSKRSALVSEARSRKTTAYSSEDPADAQEVNEA